MILASGISRRTHLIFLTLVGCMLACVALPAAAMADPVPGIGTAWPVCGVLPDDDNQYCITSQTKNGAPVVRPLTGTYEEPYVDLIGSGDVRFGVYETNVDTATQTGDVPVGDTYELVVRTGDIRPRELYGHIQDAALSIGGSAAAGWTFTLTFRPVPVAWKFFPVPACVVGSCGDDTLVADLLYSGFVTGYVTDLASLDESVPGERAMRTGFVHAYSAQDALQPAFDESTNSIIIQMANPHLRSAGVIATGTYETFIPYAMLSGLMNVPRPSTLTGGSFNIVRSVDDVSAPAPYTLTHESGGVHIVIAGITFSSPTYEIRPRKTRPGAPRIKSARRLSATSVRVRFKAPLADGGATVRKYSARCKAAGSPTRKVVRSGSPITVRRLRAHAPVVCWVRAINAIGAGSSSAKLTVAAG